MRLLPTLLPFILATHACGLLPGDGLRVPVTDFGAKPGSGENAAPAVQKAIDVCKARGAAVLVFPKGRYDFHAPKDRRVYGIQADGLKNVVIDGGGSEFVFHGIMGAASVFNSENITLRDFTVDWDRPFIVQGVIQDTTDEWVDVKFDAGRHPFEIENEKIRFLGEDWRRRIDGYSLLYEKDTKEIVHDTRDNPLGPIDKIFNTRAEDRGGGLVRFHGKAKYKAVPGTILALWLGRYIMPGFSLRGGRNITLENMDVFHALSHGVAAFRTENITLRNVNLRRNDRKGRVFSTVADGFHINTCKGLLKIERCTHTGIGDDFLNLHGKNVAIRRIVNARTLEVGVSGREGASAVLADGDEVWLVERAAMQRTSAATIIRMDDIRDGGKLIARRIVLDRELPAMIKENDLIENKTWTAALEIRDCNILKTHRARGLLVTTPGRVVIENNYFRTAGAAILIEGDADYWYESGACRDVLIRNNVFEDCLSSGRAGVWGRAVITIHPGVKPQGDSSPPYHRNIRIEHNVFKAFEPPILYARSTGGLKFAGNTLSPSGARPPRDGEKYNFILDGCREVIIDDNFYAPSFPGKTIRQANMKPGDILKKDPALKVCMQPPRHAPVQPDL
ncbi:MAG: hypothetical protein LBC18_04995 [Opitutaceae bacterium]|jgi:hypothetical protein|nr:hypothetical protein [Opitutaceae bacterium]